MKKLFAVLSVLAFLLLCTAAFADESGSESHSETGVEKDLTIQAQFQTVSPESAVSVPTVYSYTLSWEQKAGTFHRVADTYVWDAETLTYTRTQAGYWVTDAEPSLKITLQNRSNAALELNMSMEAAEGVELQMHTSSDAEGWICPAAVASGTEGAWWQQTGTEAQRTWDCGFTVTGGLESIGATGGTLSGTLCTVTIGIGIPAA